MGHFSNTLPRRFHRRDFLKAGLALPGLAAALAPLSLQNPWRTFEVSFRVEIIDASGLVRVWLPLPLARRSPYQRTVAEEWTGNAQTVRVESDARSGATMLGAVWPANSAEPALTLTVTVATTSFRVALDDSRSVAAAGRTELSRYLEPTDLIPTDGLVREKALEITRAHRTPLARARAIYDWVVDNTFHDPAVKGCGLGDIRWMLATGSLSGKCADLNALFVGLCRSVGLPARDLYGIRVAESREFKSLGRSGDVTTAQHCRAEVYVEPWGWIPVDPADVRKVALEERPGEHADDAHVRRAREMLFGAWEMNWIAFNDAHDVRLPESTGKPLPFLMYPQAEVGAIRRDSLDPSRFRYQIAARQIA